MIQLYLMDQQSGHRHWGFTKFQGAAQLSPDTLPVHSIEGWMTWDSLFYCWGSEAPDHSFEVSQLL